MKGTLKLENGKEIEIEINDEQLKELTVEKPWPQNNDKYFTLTVNGAVIDSVFCGDSIDYSRINIGNAYKTEKEAEDRVRFMKLETAIAKRRKELNGENYKITYGEQASKYNLEYSIKEYITFDTWNTRLASTPFGLFSSRDSIKTVIDEFNDELIWYFKEYLPSIN